MAEPIVKESLLHPKCQTPLDLIDEINRRTAQASSICRLAGVGDAANAMWCVECLLNDVNELANLLRDRASA